MLCSMHNIERVLALAYEIILGKQGLGENTIKQSMYMGHYVVDHFRADWKAIQRAFCDSLDQEGVSLALKLPEEIAANRWLSVARVCQNFVDICNIPAPSLLMNKARSYFTDLDGYTQHIHKMKAADLIKLLLDTNLLLPMNYLTLRLSMR